MLQSKPQIKVTKFMLVKNSTRGRSVTDVYNYTKQDVMLFQEIEKLGQGSYGTVYRAIHNVTGKIRAIKVIHKPSTKHQARLKMEVQTMQLLDHPHIVHLYECYEDTDNLYLVQEICLGGDIFDKVIEIGNFTENQAQAIFVRIMRAINYFSIFNIVHRSLTFEFIFRDLKPENFLFLNRDDLNTIQMIDFGLAKKYKLGLPMLNTKAGTAYYVAPEVLQGSYDDKCDIWSAGVILYVLFCGYPPFYGECEKEVLMQVTQGDFQFDGDEWKTVSLDAKELICNMITQLDLRFGITQVMQNCWVRSYVNDEIDEFAKSFQQIFGINNLRTFAAYPTLKKLAILYISTQLDQEALHEIKHAFIIVNKSQSGQITLQEVQDFINPDQSVLNSEIKELLEASNLSGDIFLHFSEFIAICLNPSVYLQDEYIKLVFYFLQSKEGPFIDQNSLQECLESEDNKNTNNYCNYILNEVKSDQDRKVFILNSYQISYQQFIQILQGVS